MGSFGHVCTILIKHMFRVYDTQLKLDEDIRTAPWDQASLGTDDSYVTFAATASWSTAGKEVRAYMNANLGQPYVHTTIAEIRNKHTAEYVLQNSRLIQRMVYSFPYMVGIVAMLIMVWEENHTLTVDSDPIRGIAVLMRMVSVPSAWNPVLPFSGVVVGNWFTVEPLQCWYMLLLFYFSDEGFAVCSKLFGTSGVYTTTATSLPVFHKDPRLFRRMEQLNVQGSRVEGNAFLAAFFGFVDDYGQKQDTSRWWRQQHGTAPFKLVLVNLWRPFLEGGLAFDAMFHTSSFRAGLTKANRLRVFTIMCSLGRVLPDDLVIKIMRHDGTLDRYNNHAEWDHVVGDLHAVRHISHACLFKRSVASGDVYCTNPSAHYCSRLWKDVLEPCTYYLMR